MLSTGRQVQVSTVRMLTAYLRHLVCPEAASAPCAELLRVFNTSHWRSGRFLCALLGADANAASALNASAPNTSFYNAPRAPPAASPASAACAASATSATPATPADDTALWARDWVWCEPVSALCRGSVTKAAWIHPVARPGACRVTVAQAAQNSSARVHFYLINASTARLCQLVVEWNTEIASVLCGTAGMPACADTCFFYNPTSYSADNREFEHDTVHDFYCASSATACPDPQDGLLTKLQIRSNMRLLSQCASNSLAPLLALLLAARGVINMIVELAYYGMQIALNALHLIVIGLTPAQDAISAITDRIVLFFCLSLDTLKDIITQAYSVVFKLLFCEGLTKLLVEVLQFTCHLVQWILEVPVKQAFCLVIKALAAFFGWLHGIFESIWSVHICCYRPFAALEVTISTYLKTQMQIFKVIITVACDAETFSCVFLDVDDEPRNGPGTLPIVTRCWSTYVTFYGDGQSLACTKADTCLHSLTDHSLLMCGACPEQDPPNPLTHHFGCDSITKSCTCATPRLAESLYYRQSECVRPAQSCTYLNAALGPTGAMTLCEACTTRPLCYVPRGAAVGQCACGLFEVPFAQCRPEDLGELIALPFSKMCLLQPDARSRFSTAFSAEFAQALATPCMAVDASTSFCTRMTDLAGATYIVSTHTTRARRLLEAVGSTNAQLLGPNSTRSPVCQDALAAADSHVRR